MSLYTCPRGGWVPMCLSQQEIALLVLALKGLILNEVGENLRGRLIDALVKEPA